MLTAPPVVQGFKRTSRPNKIEVCHYGVKFYVPAAYYVTE